MHNEFSYDVFLSHRAKDKTGVRRLPERLRQDGLKVWFDEWVLKPGDSIPAKIDPPPLRSYGETGERPERSRVLACPAAASRRRGMLCTSANAFGSDWAQLEAGTCGRGNLPFRDPLNRERRFLPLRGLRGTA